MEVNFTTPLNMDISGNTNRYGNKMKQQRKNRIRQRSSSEAFRLSQRKKQAHEYTVWQANQIKIWENKFLNTNFNNKVFLGDSGSYLSGSIFAYLLISVNKIIFVQFIFLGLLKK